MSIIIFLIVMIIIVAMLVYAVDQIPLTPPFGNLIKLLIVIFGVIAIVKRVGIF